MAEGILRYLAPERYTTGSAGVSPAGYVHDMAIQALREVGVDISKHESKSIEEFLPPQGEAPDVLVCLCDYALEYCPSFPRSVRRLHWPFSDPITARGTEEERMDVFRWARDGICVRIQQALSSGELDR